ncbi:MAG TPA: hypothetical protein O0X25_04130 [Methanocorpusculum sp.]|nr:hypothetical protein [Methanocorpusculum sp.]HJJ49787.1 hypothetical protein [Methanocorpusculum sp.]HJJ57375.1 hypothetical protein [Methanocorpusculum sp.]
MTLRETADEWLSSGIFDNAESFWRTSLYDLILLIRGRTKHRQNETLQQNIYEGNLLAMIANTTPRRSRKVYKWTDFYRDTSKQETKEMTSEEIAHKLHLMFGGV